MTDTPPETLIVAMLDGEWPVHAFTVEKHAIDWYQSHIASPSRRRARLWRVNLTNVVELTVVPPGPARLVAAGAHESAEPAP